MAQVKRKCDNCGKKPLREADAHDLKLNSLNSRYEWLCRECFEKWLESDGDEIK